MNRWIRGKEIKAEAEWTARWVFRYDKSPRKSSSILPFSRFPPFFSSKPRLIPHSHSFSHLSSLSLLPPSHPFCPVSSLCFFPPPTIPTEEEVARLFDSPKNRYPDERIAGGLGRVKPRTAFPRCEFSRSTVIENAISQLAKWVAHDSRGYSEVFRQPVPLACRFQVSVKIVGFNTLRRWCARRPPPDAFKFMMM